MNGKKGTAPPFQLLAVGFTSGGQMPEKLAAASPALAWSGQPPETKSFALLMEDIDSPGGTRIHWLVYGISHKESGLEAGIAKQLILSNGMRQGRNDFGEIGYTGPNPLAGTSHHYSFKLYALPAEPILPAGATKGEFRKAIQKVGGRVVAELVGKFKSEADEIASGAAPDQADPDGADGKSDPVPEKQRARLDSLQNDTVFRDELARLELQLEAMYASYPSEVTDFFRQFSFVSPFTQGKVQEYLDMIKHRDLRELLSDYVKFANRFRIQLRLKTDPLRFKRILWPEYGQKFEVKIVDDHLEPTTPVPYSEDDPYVDSFESPELKVLPRIQEMIDKGQAKFVRIKDGPGYSLLKELEHIGRKDDGLTIFLHEAEQPYLGCIFGENLKKKPLADMQKAVTEFQKEHYNRVSAGRPRKSTGKPSMAEQPAASTKTAASGSAEDVAKDPNNPAARPTQTPAKRPSRPDSAGSAAVEKKPK